MASTDGWYPVALAALIDPGTSSGTRLLGREVVVWRDAAGTVHAWEDRCPHRGMKLSFGFVRGDRLACLYHGWQYDGEGRCRYVPAHPDLDVPASIRVATYRVAERAGFVWISLDGDGADGPDVDAGGTLPVRSLYVDAPAEGTASAFAAAAVPGFDADRGGSVHLLRRHGEAGELVAALQPVAADRSALHLALGNARGDALEARLRLARWAEGFRRACEAGA